MADAEISNLQLIDENIIEEYENEDDFEISLGANIDDEMLSVEVPYTATSGLVRSSNVEEGSSVNTHKRKERQKTSFVWNHFIEINDGGVQANQCKWCKTKIKKKNLVLHLH
jgi:hypothetical protein